MSLASALSRRPVAVVHLLLPVRALFAAFRRVILTVGCCAALCLPSAVRAQSPGELDTTFTAAIVGATFYALTLEEIDQKTTVFVGGDLSLYQRLSDTGAVDTTFAFPDFGFTLQRIIYTSVLEKVITTESTPKLLIGGLFGRNSTQITDGESAQNIKRVLANGDLDDTFDPGRGADGYVTAILPLDDGSIVVGGEFDMFNKVSHEHIVKLDNSGAIVDSSVFDGSLAFDSTVLSLAQQYAADGSGLNGQILVAGTFSNVNGQTHTKLARINADGSVDASFNPVFSDRVRIVVSTSDGKILAGGDFQTVNNVAVNHLVRLNFDGSLDTTFNVSVTDMPPEIDAPVAVNTITPLGDGRYYIGGNFYTVNGVARHYLARVLNDGTVDDFDPGTTLSNTVQQVAIEPVTNKVFVTQTRDKSVNSVYPASIFRLYGDPPGVAITAAVATATSGQDGKFIVTRTNQDTSSAVRVYLTLSGTAKYAPSKKSNGDYRLLHKQPVRSGSVDGQKEFFVSIPAGVESVSISVRETATARAGTTVTLTLQPNQSIYSDYAIGADSTATVTLE